MYLNSEYVIKYIKELFNTHFYGSDTEFYEVEEGNNEFSTNINLYTSHYKIIIIINEDPENIPYISSLVCNRLDDGGSYDTQLVELTTCGLDYILLKSISGVLTYKPHDFRSLQEQKNNILHQINILCKESNINPGELILELQKELFKQKT